MGRARCHAVAIVGRRRNEPISQCMYTSKRIPKSIPQARKPARGSTAIPTPPLRLLAFSPPSAAHSKAPFALMGHQDYPAHSVFKEIWNWGRGGWLSKIWSKISIFCSQKMEHFTNPDLQSGCRDSIWKMQNRTGFKNVYSQLKRRKVQPWSFKTILLERMYAATTYFAATNHNQFDNELRTQIYKATRQIARYLHHISFWNVQQAMIFRDTVFKNPEPGKRLPKAFPGTFASCRR